MTQEINHLISSLAAIAAIIIAIAGIIRSIQRERRAKRASDSVIAKAEEAMRLASLAMERVASSRASRRAEESASSEACLARIHAVTSMQRLDSGGP